MKKLIALLLILPIWPLSSMDYVRKLFVKQSNMSKSVTIKDEGTAQVSNLVIPKVAVLTITNDLSFKDTMISLVQISKNPEIQAILLVVENYGGEGSIFSALHDTIKQIARKKSVIALVVTAFSGAYMLACAADYIIAHCASEVGNIGVIVEVQKYKNPKIRGNLKADLEVEVFFAGEYKVVSNPYKIITDQEKKYINERIKKYYDIFINLVARSRNLDVGTYLDWAEGKIFAAPEALSLGLIDEIGTIFDADKKLFELICQKNPDKQFDKEIVHIDFSTQQNMQFPKENK